MKWGRRKSSSTSSSVSKSSIFSSWLSKLRKMGTNDPVPEPQPEQVPEKLDVNRKEKGRHSWSSMSYLANAGGGKGGGRIYGGEGEAFRRLSSGDEGFYGKKKIRGVLGSALNDDPNDEIEGPRSSFMSSRSNGVREEESGRFRDMVFSIKVKELPAEEKKEMEIKTPRKGSVKEMKFKNTHRRLLEERLSKIDRELEEEDTAQPVKTVQKYCYDYNLKTIEEDHIHAPPNCGEVSEQKFSPGQEKLKELKLTTDKHRKSYYISREMQGQRTKHFSKVKVYSPRTPTKVEICKIRALEDLKRARLKTKKAKETTVLQSLAVVKCSFDPEKDFRDSMMEMILEESISKPEELEELLACYLTLNADEYHDLIIKVFRQVWLDMNDICFRGEGC